MADTEKQQIIEVTLKRTNGEKVVIHIVSNNPTDLDIPSISEVYCKALSIQRFPTKDCFDMACDAKNVPRPTDFIGTDFGHIIIY